MSRSYKHYPKINIYYGSSGKWARNQANRRIRHLPIEFEIPNGKSYKKLYPGGEIVDYMFTKFKEWEIVEWYEDQARIINNFKYKPDNITLEEDLILWKKSYMNK